MMLIDDRWKCWINSVGDKYAVGFNHVSFDLSQKLLKLYVEETLKERLSEPKSDARDAALRDVESVLSCVPDSTPSTDELLRVLDRVREVLGNG